MNDESRASEKGGTVRPVRRVAALLGFLLKMEVDAIFKQQPFETIDGSDPLDLWRQHNTKRSSLPPLVSSDVDPLPSCLNSEIQKIRERPTYKKHYESVADYSFVLAPIDSLLAPQWYADTDYMKEVCSLLQKDMDLKEQLLFAVAEGKITEPIVTVNQVYFISPRLDLYADPIPTVREIQEGEFEIVVHAARRPNYIQVAKIGDRLLLINGVHKVCALLKMGFTKTPCVFRTVGSFEETGLQRNTTLLSPPIFDSPRPALVKDFLDPSLAAPLNMRSMYQVLQINIGVGTIRVPALPASDAASRDCDKPRLGQ